MDCIKIGDEIIVVNELPNKVELEIQYQEQTNNSLKELFEPLGEDCKDVEHLKENIPSHLPQVTQNFVDGSDLDPEQPKMRKLHPQRSPPKSKEVLKKCHL